MIWQKKEAESHVIFFFLVNYELADGVLEIHVKFS